MAWREERHEIYHNAIVKIYPSGAQDVLVAGSPIFREPGWQEVKERNPAVNRSGISDEERERGNLERSRRRARARVREICLANEFKWFVTFTLDSSRIDRYDYSAIIKRLNIWLAHQVQRRGLRYVLVPELHKDGAIHFHGFINDALDSEWSGTMIPQSGGKPRKVSAASRTDRRAEGWRDVYNLPGWDYGFTTAIQLYGEYSAAVGYVLKYITKAGTKIGGRWYLSGGRLAAPEKVYADLSYFDAEGWEGARQFEIDGVGRFVRCFFEGGENL